jgi:hypothetical protein
MAEMGQEQEMGHTSEQGGNKRSAAMCERASARVHTRTHMYALYVCLDTQAAEGLLVLRMPYMYALNVCLKCMPYMQAAEDRAEARQTSCPSRFLPGARTSQPEGGGGGGGGGGGALPSVRRSTRR